MTIHPTTAPLLVSNGAGERFLGWHIPWFEDMAVAKNSVTDAFGRPGGGESLRSMRRILL